MDEDGGSRQPDSGNIRHYFTLLLIDFYYFGITVFNQVVIFVSLLSVFENRLPTFVGYLSIIENRLLTFVGCLSVIDNQLSTFVRYL
jgi:hypothetical protein